VKEKVLPELNDEFAKSFGAENLEKLVKASAKTSKRTHLQTRQQPWQSVIRALRTSHVRAARHGRRAGDDNVGLRHRPRKSKTAASDERSSRRRRTKLRRRCAERQGTREARLLFRKSPRRKTSSRQRRSPAPRPQRSRRYQVSQEVSTDLQKKNGLIEIYDQLANERSWSFSTERNHRGKSGGFVRPRSSLSAAIDSHTNAPEPGAFFIANPWLGLVQAFATIQQRAGDVLPWERKQ